MTRRISRPLALVAALAAMAVAAPSANAGVLVATADNCPDQTAAQVFQPWLDPMSYTLVPGGTLEGGAPGWSLNGASVVSGNEPWQVHGDGESSSLKIPAGKSATTDTICVGLEHPTLRLFARNSTALVSTLSVEVIFKTSLGLKASAPVGVLLPSGQWKPSPRLLVVANLLPLLPGEHTPVQFRVRSVGLGTWWVDDFYVDPRCH